MVVRVIALLKFMSLMLFVICVDLFYIFQSKILASFFFFLNVVLYAWNSVKMLCIIIKKNVVCLSCYSNFYFWLLFRCIFSNIYYVMGTWKS
jgi:hypothetical protein